MANGQALLDLMEVLDNELQLQSSESDVTRGLIALNTSQDTFESMVAAQPNVLGSSDGGLTIGASQETTVFPPALLRLDALWMLDLATGVIPIYKLTPLDEVGGHAINVRWPLTLSAAGTTTGAPIRYWTNGHKFYWHPKPDVQRKARWYGFQSAPDITANGFFTYPDIAQLPIATFAVKLFRAGLGDDSVDLDQAYSSFGPVVKQLAYFHRDRPKSLSYTQHHTT